MFPRLSVLSLLVALVSAAKIDVRAAPVKQLVGYATLNGGTTGGAGGPTTTFKCFPSHFDWAESKHFQRHVSYGASPRPFNISSSSKHQNQLPSLAESSPGRPKSQKVS
ncbi:hypothetical protein DFH09DRAFT_1110652 [Mycena vulgaris]|nr:hypothetical protein DFH09DRAFT_1110652 [Mycena vulgaris]